MGLFWDDGVEGVGVEVEGVFAEKAWRAYGIHLIYSTLQRECLYSGHFRSTLCGGNYVSSLISFDER